MLPLLPMLLWLSVAALSVAPPRREVFTFIPCANISDASCTAEWAALWKASDGQVTTACAFSWPPLPSIVADMHAKGVKLVRGAPLSPDPRLQYMNQSALNAWVKTMATSVAAAGADGINIDIEVLLLPMLLLRMLLLLRLLPMMLMLPMLMHVLPMLRCYCTF
jgi:hypothetical protein